MMNFTILLLAQCGLLLGQGFVRCPVRQVATTTVQPAPAERRGAGASEEEQERRKQAEEQRLIEAHRQNPKLPRESMPKSGRIADFDFDNWNMNSADGTQAKFLRGKRNQLELCDGYLKVKVGDHKVGVFTPDFNYDHFTIAMSFNSQSRYGELFNLGLKWGIGDDGALRFDVRLHNGSLSFGGCKADGHENNILHVGKGMSTNEWNWLVCSVDAVAQRVGIVVNGFAFSGRLLNGLSCCGNDHPPEPTFRGWGASALMPDEWIRGVGFWVQGVGGLDGWLDDIIIYNRALSEREMAVIAKRMPCGDESALDAEARANTVKVLPRPGCWLLTKGTEQSFRWNDFITDGTNTLAVRNVNSLLELAPLIYSRATGELDLSKPIEDEGGHSYYLTGLAPSEIYLEAGDQNDRISRVILPCSLKWFSAGAFSLLSALKEVVFCGDMPQQSGMYPRGFGPVMTAYADSKGWPNNGLFVGCKLKIVERPQSASPYVPQGSPQFAAKVVQHLDGNTPKATPSREVNMELMKRSVPVCDGVNNGTTTNRVRRGLLGGARLIGGSQRARRMERQRKDQGAARKQQSEETASAAERQPQTDEERAQREAERMEQRQQLLAIQEELKRVREAKASSASEGVAK